MANQKQLTLLQWGGVALWNQWRLQYPETRPDLHLANLRGEDLCDANLSGADLSKTILCDAGLCYTNLSGADLSGANLFDANLFDANLSEADLCYANLNGANLNSANLSNACLNGAILRSAYLLSTHLYGADLHSADLKEVRLFNANLCRADLGEANLRRADLSNADLRRADLRDADLRGANLSNASLSGANLSGADLSGADLSDARMNAAILGNATTRDTVFARVDLRKVKGLTEIRHRGPSRVELSSVQLPQDGSAQHFLRGAGVPEEWIDFYQSTMIHPIQYHSCFISYTHQDEVLARRLHADLQDEGVRCWFAPEDMKIGDKFRARIDEAIHLQDKLLLLLSEHAVASAWVEDEVEAALEKERCQQREVLFPVRLDETVMQTGTAWAASLRRTRHIGDFTHWTDPQAYQQAFERLLRDLKAEF